MQIEQTGSSENPCPKKTTRHTVVCVIHDGKPDGLGQVIIIVVGVLMDCVRALTIALFQSFSVYFLDVMFFRLGEIFRQFCTKITLNDSNKKQIMLMKFPVDWYRTNVS